MRLQSGRGINMSEINDLYGALDNRHEDRFTLLFNDIARYVPAGEDQDAILAELNQYGIDHPKPPEPPVMLDARDY
jgi:hypothetical protein